MPKSGKEFMAEIKQTIAEITPQATLDKINHNSSTIFLDVREREEWNQGHLPGAIFIPRGHLELQIENYIPQRDQEMVIYCAGDGHVEPLEGPVAEIDVDGGRPVVGLLRRECEVTAELVGDVEVRGQDDGALR